MRKRWLWFLPAALMLVAILTAGGLVWRNLATPPALDVQAMQAKAQAPKAPNGPAKISEVSAITYVQAQTQAARLQQQSGYAALLIPSVAIKLPVFAQMTNLTLAAGVARYFPDRPLGVGNNVFAAHNFHGGGEVLLTALNRVKIGAAVYLTDSRQVYTYRVIDNRVVKETEIQVLAETKEDRVTLIRCEGPIGTAYRRVVVARRVATTKVAATKVHQQVSAPSKLSQWLVRQPWYSAFALLFLNGRITGWLWGLLLDFVSLMLLGGVGFVRQGTAAD